MRCLALFTVLLALTFLVGCIGATNGSGSASFSSKPEKIGIATPVEDDRFEVTITKIDMRDTITSQAGYLTFAKPDPSKDYLIVGFTVKNLLQGKERFTPLGTIRVFDHEGDEYFQDFSAGKGFLGGYDFTEFVGPGETVSGYEVFVVPKNSGSQLEVHVDFSMVDPGYYVINA